jgi:hypothetical protein
MVRPALVLLQAATKQVFKDGKDKNLYKLAETHVTAGETIACKN